MSIRIFKYSPKFSLSECCHYSRYDICAMFSAHNIPPDVLYRCYASCTSNPDTLYRKLLIPFRIKLVIFLTIKTHTHTHTHTHWGTCSVVDRLYATSRKVACSRPVEVNKCSIYITFHSAQGPVVYSTCNRNEYQKQKMFLESRASPERKADNLTGI
jgi:hypothetical protein